MHGAATAVHPWRLLLGLCAVHAAAHGEATPPGAATATAPARGGPAADGIHRPAPPRPRVRTPAAGDAVQRELNQAIAAGDPVFRLPAGDIVCSSDLVARCSCLKYTEGGACGVNAQTKTQKRTRARRSRCVRFNARGRVFKMQTLPPSPRPPSRVPESRSC